MVMPSLTLPQSRQRQKNVYGFLPRRQEELGRRQSRSIRIFSTESLLSRNSDSPTREHVPSQARNVLPVREAHTCTLGYAVGVYDNGMVPQMCDTLTPSAHYINIGASRDDLSISSEDSRDYVNVPRAEEIAENLTSDSPGTLFVLPNAQELDFTEEGHESCGHGSDCSSSWSPVTKSPDRLSDEESSSQTSNDYVNMSELYLGTMQGEQPWVALQGCRDYINVPPVNADGSQLQATDHVEDRTEALGNDTQPAMKSGSPLASAPHVTFQPVALSGSCQMRYEEELSSEDDGDYENVLPAVSGGKDCQQGLGTQLLPDEIRPSHPAEKLHGVLSPAGSIATTEADDDS
ncbi:lymphocyte transmembrane adapter 1 [Rhynchocyon petersi]